MGAARHALAVGGHFRERATGLRYDTRILDVRRDALVRSFACNLFSVAATASSDNPFVGPVVVDGGADHAVKVWRANGRGSTTCKPGQARAADGRLVSAATAPDATGPDERVLLWTPSGH